MSRKSQIQAPSPPPPSSGSVVLSINLPFGNDGRPSNREQEAVRAFLQSLFGSDVLSRGAVQAGGNVSAIEAVRGFVAARCEVGGEERAAALFDGYTRWAAATGAPKLSRKAFAQSLTKLHFSRRRSNIVIWCGLHLAVESSRPGGRPGGTGLG